MRSSLPTPPQLGQPRLRDLAAHRGWHGQLSALWGFSRREYFILQSYKSRQIMWVLDS
jgi:hypothetical protein